MKAVIELLSPLATAVGMSITTGMYFKIGKKKISFSWGVFIDGLWKALIVGSTFIGLAYISKYTKLEFAPTAIMVVAIAFYGGKVTNNLLKILGINISLLLGKTKNIEDMVDVIKPEVTSVE